MSGAGGNRTGGRINRGALFRSTPERHDRAVTSEHLLDGGIVEREFTLDQVPGILWTPASATPSAPAPVILLGHPGGLRAMHPRLEARARHSAALGFATAAHRAARER